MGHAPVWTPYAWKPGEHVALVGRTGSGKTAVESYLLRAHLYTVALKSKADNTRLPGKLIRKAKDINDIRETRFVLDPDYKEQRLQFAVLFEEVWKQKAWTVAIDELFALDNQLKLTWFIERQLTQGRSAGLSTILGMQRPKRISRFALTQATHYIIFAQNGDDLAVVCDETTAELKPVIAKLQRYEFVWYYKPENHWWIGTLQRLARKGR